MKDTIIKMYWDTSVWISWSKNENNAKNLCSELIRDTLNGKTEIIVSPIVIAEFADVDNKFENFIKNPCFIKTGVNWKTAYSARDLIRKYKLSSLDALHIACALYSESNYLFSYDKHFLKLSNQIKEIKICPPKFLDGQERLFIDEAAAGEDNRAD